MRSIRKWTTNERAVFLAAAALAVLIGLRFVLNIREHPLPGQPSTKVPEVLAADGDVPSVVQRDPFEQLWAFGARDFFGRPGGYPVHFRTTLFHSVFVQSKEEMTHRVAVVCRSYPGSTDRLRIHLPAGLTISQVRGDTYKEHIVQTVEDHQVCTITLNKPTKGDVEINLRVSQPVAGRIATVPWISLEGTEHMEGHIGVSQGAGLTVKPSGTRGVNTITVAQLPMRMRLAGPVLGFHFETSKYSLSLQVLSGGEVAVGPGPPKPVPPKPGPGPGPKPGPVEPGPGPAVPGVKEFPYAYSGIVQIAGKRCIFVKDKEGTNKHFYPGDKIEEFTLDSVSATSAIFIDAEGKKYELRDAFYRLYAQ